MQLDCDEEMGHLHGMYGSVQAEFEVQRTIKRAELTAFLCLLKQVIGFIMVHVDDEKENASIRKMAMLTCGSKLVKNCTRLKRNLLVEVVNAQRRTRKRCRILRNL